MKIIYDEATDSLDILLREGEAEESQELAPGVILDMDEQGEPLSIEILRASTRVDLGSKLEFLRSIPATVERPPAA